MSDQLPPVTEAERDSSAGQNNFQFITVSATNLRGDAATRRRVRSHAQADYRRRNPPPPPRPLTVELDATPLLDGSLQGRHGPVFQHPQYTTQGQAAGPSMPGLTAAGPLTVRDASRSDTLGKSTVDRNHRSRLLWDHLYDGTCIVFKTMLEIGFIDIVRESASLTQMLSTSAWHLDHSVNDDNRSSEYAGYSVMATQSLRRKLSNSRTRTANEVIVAVLAFACYANLIGDPQLINIHLDGLSQILGHRGGLGSVENMPVLRVMIYWVDLNGSYLQDGIPRYSQPFQILATRSKLNFAASPIDRLPPHQNLWQDTAVSRICNMLRQVNGNITTELLVRDLWQDILFPGFHLSPILHDLLSMPRGTIHESVYVRRRECFRLAAILYVTELRGRFGIETAPAILYASKLRNVLKTGDTLVPWNPSNIFLLWSLTVAASSTCVSADLRHDFADMLSVSVQAAGLTRFTDLVAMITKFLWCDEALGRDLRALKDRISFTS